MTLNGKQETVSYCLDSGGRRHVGHSFGFMGGVIITEDAAIIILMMIFGAENATFEKRIKFGSQQHRE